MEKAEMSRVALEAKKRKGQTWAALSEATGMAEVYLASVLYGESSASKEVAAKLCELLGLEPGVGSAMTEFAVKGKSLGEQSIPRDPLMYRFYEIMAVYGLSIKDVVQEKFGDGIMSAIDFSIDVERKADPKGDRVVVTMSGKFLPYKKW